MRQQDQDFLKLYKSVRKPSLPSPKVQSIKKEYDKRDKSWLNVDKDSSEEDYIPISEQIKEVQDESWRDYKIEFCSKCCQITNHYKGKCQSQKCKGSK